MPSGTIEDIRKVIALSDLPEEQLKWIAERSEYHEYEDGTQLTKSGDPSDLMWLMIEGKVAFYMDMSGRQVHFYDFHNDAVSTGADELLPHSGDARGGVMAGISSAVGEGSMAIRFARKYLQEL